MYRRVILMLLVGSLGCSVCRAAEKVEGLRFDLSTWKHAHVRVFQFRWDGDVLGIYSELFDLLDIGEADRKLLVSAIHGVVNRIGRYQSGAVRRTRVRSQIDRGEWTDGWIIPASPGLRAEVGGKFYRECVEVLGEAKAAYFYSKVLQRSDELVALQALGGAEVLVSEGYSAGVMFDGRWSGGRRIEPGGRMAKILNGEEVEHPEFSGPSRARNDFGYSYAPGAIGADGDLIVPFGACSIGYRGFSVLDWETGLLSKDFCKIIGVDGGEAIELQRLIDECAGRISEVVRGLADYRVDEFGNGLIAINGAEDACGAIVEEFKRSAENLLGEDRAFLRSFPKYGTVKRPFRRR